MEWDSPDIIDLLALTSIQGVGLATQQKLLQSFSRPADIFRAKRDELKQLGYLSDKQIDSILMSDGFSVAERQLQKMKSLNVKLVVQGEAGYPKRLNQIATSPLVLFCRGNLDLLEHELALGVVGSRRMSRYGKRVIETFVPEWVGSGYVIVSGMAFGVDCCAHNASIKAGGKTIAVQAQGVDRGYPISNAMYYDEILSHDGLVVSEFFSLPSESNEKFLFPRRNRIISGLSEAVVVIEANAKSGALITARFALEQGRDVYAVPGDVFSSLSAGCHALIREGAHPLFEASQVQAQSSVFAQSVSQHEVAVPVNLDLFETPLEASIFRLCRTEPKSIDMLIDEINEQPSFVSATVTKMQILGRLSEVEGKKFVAQA